MTIEYRVGDLLTAPAGALLVHACNAKGVWGSGIAKQFKDEFPDEFEEYAEYCQEQKLDAVGTCLISNSRRVGCLITSFNYGKNVDKPSKILDATRTTFESLLKELNDPSIEIHMPMINSGLFNVEWNLTEVVLNEVLASYGNKCVVWTLKEIP